VSFEQPYAGLKVVDLSQGVAGPYCAMLLGRQGADVIKIEPPDGDWSRKLEPSYGDNTAFSIAANLGKRAIAVDVKSERGRAIVDELLAGADVFLEGFRPGVIDRLGFSYERLSQMVPGLIYVSVSGFGQIGPLKDKPAMDPILQAFTGFMSENTGEDGIPHRSPTIVNDMSTALYATQAVAAALYARRDDARRRGRRITISLMEASANLQCIRLMGAVHEGTFKRSMVPNGTFVTGDGFLQLIVLRDGDFQKLREVLDDDAITNDRRFDKAEGRLEHGDELTALINGVLKTRPGAYWRDKMTAAGLQNEVVQSYREFAHHPQVEATDLISWLVQPGADDPWAVANVPTLPPPAAGSADALAPRVGHHTREVLTELGYGMDEIDALAADGIIGL